MSEWQEVNKASIARLAPLLPTAEQTSIARFNALADQVRLNHDESLGEIGASRAALQHQLDDLRDRLEEIKNAQMNIAVGINKIAEVEQQHYANLMQLTAIQWDSLSKEIKKRAVAKKKAAPLVGKKGTGRKG